MGRRFMLLQLWSSIGPQILNVFLSGMPQLMKLYICTQLVIEHWMCTLMESCICELFTTLVISQPIIPCLAQLSISIQEIGHVLCEVQVWVHGKVV